MSQVLDLCEDSEDNGEWSNTASVAYFHFPERDPDKGGITMMIIPRSAKKARHKIATAGFTEEDVDKEDQSRQAETMGLKQDPRNCRPRNQSNASGRQYSVSAWEDRLIELCYHREIHGHCNVPRNSSENSKLAKWVGTQRSNTGCT
jgi:hypothetical protein